MDTLLWIDGPSPVDGLTIAAAAHTDWVCRVYSRTAYRGWQQISGDMDHREVGRYFNHRVDPMPVHEDTAAWLDAEVDRLTPALAPAL